MKIYKEMNRQDKEAAKTGTVPEYLRTGTVDMSRGKNYSSGSGTTSNASQNYSSGKRN